MKRLLGIVGIIAAAILSGCAGGGAMPTLDPALNDWCYTFDFHADAQGFAIEHGEQNVLGLQTDPSGVLIASYGYDRRVIANSVVVSVRRPPASVGDITVNADSAIFSVKAQLWDQVLPGAVEQIFLPYANTSVIDESGLQTYDYIRIHVEATQPIVIESIQVFGDGASPFPENECQLATNTPTTEPSTPFPGTGTPTPTPTSTPTGTLATPTPTATSTPGPWTCEYDFTTGEHGWTFGLGFGSYQDENGWNDVADGTYYRGTSIGYHFDTLTTITYVEFNFSLTQGEQAGPQSVFHTVLSNSPIAEQFLWVTPGDYRDNPSSPITASGEWDLNDLYIILYTGVKAGGGDPGGDATITSAVLSGDGYKPCEDEPTPTPTPGPSPTPGPTSTFQPLWNACLDFTANAFGFSSEDAIYVDDYGFAQTAEEWAFGRSGVVAGQKKKIRIDFGAGQTFTGDVRLSDHGTNATSWKAASGNSIIVDFTGEAWLPNTTFWVEFDGNMSGLIAQKLCWLDPNPATKTPTPGPTPTGTLPTRTPFPFASPTQTATSYRTPITPFVITSTPGIFITSTSSGGGGGGGTATPGASSTPGGGGGGTPDGSGDAGDLLGSAWDIGSGLFKVGGAYLGQISDAAGSMITALNTSAPQPINGLPQCMTNPMKHDICAIYYIMHWTLLAPNTPGALIIPLIIILMNFFIVIKFLRWGWRIVSRGEEMTNE